jgi:hypothetical protein
MSASHQSFLNKNNNLVQNIINPAPSPINIGGPAADFSKKINNNLTLPLKPMGSNNSQIRL